MEKTFNEDNYFILKSLAEKKSTGANIHSINGCLHSILNSAKDYIYWIEIKNFEEAQIAKDSVEKSLEKFYSITGIKKDFAFLIS